MSCLLDDALNTQTHNKTRDDDVTVVMSHTQTHCCLATRLTHFLVWSFKEETHHQRDRDVPPRHDSGIQGGLGYLNKKIQSNEFAPFRLEFCIIIALCFHQQRTQLSIINFFFVETKNVIIF